MKNRKMSKERFVCAAIMIVTLILCMFSISANAISEKCVTDHFDNLNNTKFDDEFFVPPNPDGSCPYLFGI